jgi:teichuronic acid biosynthesis glycosyltransferase TuaC
MRVLAVSHMFPTLSEPELGIFVLEQIRALRSLGVETVVLAPTPWVPSFLKFARRGRKYTSIPPKATLNGIAVDYPRCLSLPRGWLRCLYGFFYYFGCYRLARRLARESKIDLIHAHCVLPDGFAAVLLGRKMNLPVVCTAHGSEIRLYPWCSRLTRWATKWALRRIGCVIAVSQDLRETIFSLVGPRQLALIHNGADPATFKPFPKGEARAKLDLPRDKRIILFVGNLFPVKGIEYLLEAVALLPRQDLLLCLVGEGDLKTAVASQARRLGIAQKCRLVGRRPHDEVPWWLSAAECLVLSSLSEGLPTILPEAMLCRVPIVATAVGGIPEIVSDGYTGLLVPVKDPAALARAVDALLMNDERVGAMVERAESRAKSDLTWEVNARKTLALYRGVMCAGSAGSAPENTHKKTNECERTEGTQVCV